MCFRRWHSLFGKGLLYCVRFLQIQRSSRTLLPALEHAAEGIRELELCRDPETPCGREVAREPVPEMECAEPTLASISLAFDEGAGGPRVHLKYVEFEPCVRAVD